MNLILDSMTSHIGWTTTSGVCSITTTNWSEYAVNFRSSQVSFQAQAGAVVSKTFNTPISIDGLQTVSIPLVGNTTELIFRASDFRLKVRFYNGVQYEEFYVNVDMALTPRVFALGLTTITKIEFRFISALTIMVSQILAYVDTMPYDIYNSISEMIQVSIDSTSKIQIGTTTCSIGDRKITVNNLKYADKLMVIEIGNEIHQIASDVSKDVISFLGYGDGVAIRNNYVNEPVYLYMSTAIEPDEDDAFIPFIGISKGFGVEVVQDEEAYSYTLDSWNTDGTIRSMSYGTSWKYSIVVSAGSRVADINEYLLTILKKAFNKQTIIWINNRKHELKAEKIEWIEYGDATEILSKIQIECIVECAEEIWHRETQPIDLEIQKSVSLMNV